MEAIGGNVVTETRKKSLSVIYNGTEAWSELFPVMDRFTYTDSVDQSDTISFEISDRDQKWIKDGSRNGRHHRAVHKKRKTGTTRENV